LRYAICDASDKVKSRCRKFVDRSCLISFIAVSGLSAIGSVYPRVIRYRSKTKPQSLIVPITDAEQRFIALDRWINQLVSPTPPSRHITSATAMQAACPRCSCDVTRVVNSDIVEECCVVCLYGQLCVCVCLSVCMFVSRHEHDTLRDVTVQCLASCAKN